MSIIVQKYGGTSVGNTERIKNVAQKLAGKHREGYGIVVVVSAMGHTTDELLGLAEDVSKRPPLREVSQLLSTGEQVSASLLVMALDSLGIPAISLTGGQAGIQTDPGPVNAHITAIDSERIRKSLTEGKVVVVAGFQGQNPQQDITTLGRGGSDTTAVVLAAAIKAKVCEIFTDVEGVFTVDPRVVKSARKLATITYDEMLELATQGAQVLHPRAVECAKEYGIDLHVRSSFTENEGTTIMEEDKMEKGTVVRGIAFDGNQVKFAVLSVPDKPGMAFQIFNALSEAEISVDLIVQSVHKNGVNDILFTVVRDDAEKVMSILEPLCEKIGAEKVTKKENVAKISVVGIGMTNKPGVASKMFGALAEKGINIEIISTSEIRISCLIAEDRVEEAAEAIHDIFNLG